MKKIMIIAALAGITCLDAHAQNMNNGTMQNNTLNNSNQNSGTLPGTISKPNNSLTPNVGMPAQQQQPVNTNPANNSINSTTNPLNLPATPANPTSPYNTTPNGIAPNNGTQNSNNQIR